MKKSIKKILVSTLAVASLSALAVGVNALNASANTEKVFQMEKGAYVKAEVVGAGKYGLRFIAQMNETTYNSVSTADGEYFGMLIVPYDYITDYATEISAKNGDYITAFGSVQNLPLLNLANITPYETATGYAMNGVISTIQYKNLNRDFVGIGYYLDSELGYVYTAIDDSYARNVYEISEAALADTTKDYTLSQLECLYEYKYLAEEQAKGTAETTAKANLATAIASDVHAKFYKLSGDQVANFDRAEYIDLVGKGSSTEDRVAWGRDNDMSAPVIENGYGDVTSGVLKMHSTGYANVKIAFPKKVTVGANTYVTLKVHTEKDFRIAKYGDNSNRLPTYVSTYTKLTTKTNAWTTIAIKTIDIGYAEGDILDGIEIVFYVATVYIDEVSVFSFDLTGDQVATFDRAEYAMFVGKGSSTHKDVEWGRENYQSAPVIENGYGDVTSGVLKLHSTGYANVKIAFPKKVTVGANTYVTLKVHTERDFYIAKYGDNSDKLPNYVSTYTKLTTKTNAWTTIAIKTTDIGYAEGDILDGIEIVFYKATVYIDEICVVDLLEGAQVVNFDYSLHENYVTKNNNYSGGNGSMEISVDTVNAYRDTTGYLSVYGKTYSTFDIKFIKSVAVTENSMLVLRIASTETNTFGVRVGAYGNTGASNQYAGKALKYFGFDDNSSNWQTIAIPLLSTDAATLQAQVGQPLEGVQIIFQGDSTGSYVYIDYISVIDFSAGLTGNQVANFDGAEYVALTGVGSATHAGVNWGAKTYMTTSWKDGALEITSTGYANSAITFPKNVTVGADTQITLKVNTTIDFRLKKLGNGGTGLDWAYVSTITGTTTPTNTWTTITVKATDIGFAEGDTLDGIEIIFYIGTMYLDEITVTA